MTNISKVDKNNICVKFVAMRKKLILENGQMRTENKLRKSGTCDLRSTYRGLF